MDEDGNIKAEGSAQTLEFIVEAEDIEEYAN